jgi:hypothetical protein
MTQVFNRLRHYLPTLKGDEAQFGPELTAEGLTTSLFISILITSILVGPIFTPAAQAVSSEKDEAVDLKVLGELTDNLSTFLISVHNVIGLSQELINKDPLTGNFYFKGLVPIVVGRMAAENFYIRTGIHIKQTSLRLRNPENVPDKWEAQVLKNMEAPDYPKGKTYSEVILPDGKKVYRYMKPLYIEEPCLPCHLEREKIPQYIRTYLEEHYPTDEAVGYKLGDLRGAISITIPLNDEGVVSNKKKEGK